MKHIPAPELPNYYLCLREILAEIEKKNLKSIEEMKKTAQDLISQATSQLFPKPSDNPSATSSLN
jgi:hypothetical protein